MIKGRFALFCDYALTSSDNKVNLLVCLVNEKEDDEIFKQNFDLTTSPEGKANIMIEF